MRLDSEAIVDAIEEPFRAFWTVDVLECVDSTNDAVREGLGDCSEQLGRALFAERQLAGRGRRGARWFSGEPEDQLTFSCAIRPPWPVEKWSRLTHVAALALARTIEDIPPAMPQVKWPNDVYLNGRKTAGILVETHLGGVAKPYAVVGIGVNLNTAIFPDELKGIATSVGLSTGVWVDRAVFAGGLLSHLARLLPLPESAFPSIAEELQAAALWLGRRVGVTHRHEKLYGCYEGLGPEGELLLRLEDGRVLALTTADEVRLAE